MMTWTKEADGSFISVDERFLLHKRPDRHYDVIPADGPKLNKSRLSLTAAKELAEQTAAGPIVKDCTGQPLPAEAMAMMHDGGDVGSIPVGSLTAGMRAILSPVAEQRTKKPKVGKPLIEVLTEPERPAGAIASGTMLAEPVEEPKAKPKKVKKEPKLRGGIGGDPKVETPPPLPPALTPTQIQAKLDELVWRHGSNITEWLDYPKLLADAGLHPEQVTDFMIELAAEHAKERQTREAKREEGLKEYRLGNLYVGCYVEVAGRKARILDVNDSEVKVEAFDEHGKKTTQGWSAGTMARTLSYDEFYGKGVPVQASAEPTAKEAKQTPGKAPAKAKKATTAAQTGEGTDSYGNRLGSAQAKACAILSSTPKKMAQIVKDAGVSGTVYNCFNALVAAGKISKTAAGYTILDKK